MIEIVDEEINQAHYPMQESKLVRVEFANQVMKMNVGQQMQALTVILLCAIRI